MSNKERVKLSEWVARGADEALGRLSDQEIAGLLQDMFMRLAGRDEERLMLQAMLRLERTGAGALATKEGAPNE